MKYPTKNIIFDFDGVLVESDTGRFLSLKKILEERNISLPINIILENFIGCSTKTILKKIFGEINKEEFDTIVALRHNEYLNNLDKYCLPSKNLLKILNILYSKDINLYLATTNAQKNICKLIEYLGISHFFKKVIGREICENEKGVKDYGLIKMNLDVNIEDSVVVEDSEFGINSAKENGFFVFAFNPKYQNCKADKIITDLLELDF